MNTWQAIKNNLNVNTYKLSTYKKRKTKTKTQINIIQLKTFSKFRKKALKERTNAEIWAQEILNEHFKEMLQVEYIYKTRRFDFYLPTLRIAIEIDGKYHNQPDQNKKDIESDKEMIRSKGILVLRVANFDQERIMEVISNIKEWELITKAPKNKNKKDSYFRVLRHFNQYLILKNSYIVN